jgi:hypothetical protein
MMVFREHRTPPFVGCWFFSSRESSISAKDFLPPANQSHSPPGTPLVIRFYDSISLDNATYFNAVSNSTGSWNWIEPTDPISILTLTLSDPGLVWQDGAASALRTTIPIPEPATSVLAACALLLGIRRLRTDL